MDLSLSVCHAHKICNENWSVIELRCSLVKECLPGTLGSIPRTPPKRKGPTYLKDKENTVQEEGGISYSSL